jgi:hypothetical protein
VQILLDHEREFGEICASLQMPLNQGLQFNTAARVCE